MKYLLCRQRVDAFDHWKAVFDSHAAAQREAGLRLQHVWRNLDRPDEVFMLFKVADLAKARSFVTAPDVESAVRASGAAERAEVFFLEQP
jgi:hypothetical protein